MYYKINKNKNIFICFFVLKHDFILHVAGAVGIPILLSGFGIIYIRRVTNRRWGLWVLVGSVGFGGVCGFWWGPWGLWGPWVLVGSMGRGLGGQRVTDPNLPTRTH